MKKKEINEVKDTRNDGRYQGKEYLFTHRNPKNGDLYGENIPIVPGSLIQGKWVSSDSVTFD